MFEYDINVVSISFHFMQPLVNEVYIILKLFQIHSSLHKLDFVIFLEFKQFRHCKFLWNYYISFCVIVTGDYLLQVVINYRPINKQM